MTIAGVVCLVLAGPEEELVNEAQFGRKWATVGAGALAAVGLGLVVAGLAA
jgi:hypothetical protein